MIVRTVNSSLLNCLLLAALFGGGRSVLIVSSWAGGTFLATGLLRGGNNTAAAIAFDLATGLFNLPEGVAMRGLHAVYRRASELGGSFLPVDL